MVKRLFKNLLQNFCIYLLAVMNLVHAIQVQCFDWLLWVSLILVAASLVLNLASAIKGGGARA